MSTMMRRLPHPSRTAVIAAVGAAAIIIMISTAVASGARPGSSDDPVNVRVTNTDDDPVPVRDGRVPEARSDIITTEDGPVFFAGMVATKVQVLDDGVDCFHLLNINGQNYFPDERDGELVTYEFASGVPGNVLEIEPRCDQVDGENQYHVIGYATR